MNNDLMFSSKSEMWETPQAFFDDLNNLFQFTLDACATPENAKCERYFTPEMDGLKQDWDGVVWCNPPYGRGVGAWVEKAHRTAEESDATLKADAGALRNKLDAIEAALGRANTDAQFRTPKACAVTRTGDEE